LSSFKDAPPARIAVIGGGVSGLSVCYKLNQLLPEERIHLYESSSRLGGKVGSLKKDGFIFELGPDCFIKEKPFPLQLAEETGNKEAIIATNEKNRGTFVYSRGKLHELPDGMMSFVPTKFLPFLKTGLFTWRGKLRMAFDLFLPRGQNDDPTLAAFVGRRFGWEAVDRLAAPLIAGIYGSDSEELSLKATFPRFLEMEEKYRSLIIGFLKARRTLQRTKDNYGLSYFLSFKDGMQQLVEILKANIQNTHVFLQRQVLKISIEEGRIAVIDSKGRKNFYQAVIVAVPAFEAVNILPESLETERRLLREIRYNSVATGKLVL
jgi:oxygen-dependent protoporphyrinogen oxidase